MNMQPAKLTKDLLDKLPPADAGQYIVRDTEEPGFFVVVGKRSKTFTVQIDVTNPLGKRQTRKQAVGKWPNMGVAEARRAARSAKVAISSEKARTAGRALTLGDAWAELRGSLEREVASGRRSQRTVDSYEYGAQLLRDWHDTPLTRLSDNAGEVRKRHRELSAASGPSAANGAMVFLRRTYNYAQKRRLDPNLPHYNPVDSVDLNPSARRDTAMSAADLAGWYGKLRALPNVVRQEFHLFSLLSGARPGALTIARWEDLDMGRRVLHIPKPKGGTKRAFDIPLSRSMIACLARVRRAGRIVNARNADEWVFPGDLSRSRRNGGPLSAGHIVEYREDRDALPKWGGDLRQTYKTLSSEAGLSKTDVMILMNHADGDVNDGYMTRNKVAEDYLRAQQEAMSRYIMAACHRG